MYIPWGGTRTLAYHCPIVSWLPFLFLCIPSFFWSTIIWICPLELKQGLGGRNFSPTNKKWGTWKGIYKGKVLWGLAGSIPSFLCYSSILTGYWVRTRKGKKFWIDRLIINLAEELGFNQTARIKTHLTHKRRNQQCLCMWPAGLDTPIKKVRGTSQVLGTSVAMPSLPLDKAGLPGQSSRDSGIWGLGSGLQVWVEYGYMLSPGACCVCSL